MTNFKGQWIWLTGASSGLGLEMARQLAKAGAHLILTARRADRLEALATELRALGVEVRVLTGDMSRSDDVERLLTEVKQSPVTIAVLNAGVTHFGHHHELEWKAFEAMLHTNVISVTRLTSELVRHFDEKKVAGTVQIVSSLTGLMPVPFQSAYSGTKAYLVAFGTSLAHELAGKPVKVTVFAPGGIATEQTAGERFASLKGWLAPVESAAAAAVAALRKAPPLYVQGAMNRLGMFAFRFLPRALVMWGMARTYRNALLAAETRSKP